MPLPTADPLLHWDGIHLKLSLTMVEQRLRELLQGSESIRELSLSGEGDLVRLRVLAQWRGIRTRVVVEVGELRLRHRLLGFRIRKVRMLGGVPVPRPAIEAILRSLRTDLVKVMGGQRIVILDLHQWLPPEISLSVLTVQVSDRSLHLWLGAGDLWDVPRGQHPALPEPAEKLSAAP